MTLSLGPRVRRRALMPHMPRRLLPVVAQRPRCRCTTRGGGRPRLHERGDPVNESMLTASSAVGLALNPCEGVLALSDDGPKRPPELKWYISEYMNDDAILKHVAFIIDTFVVTLADDFADWFYQLKLMAGCYWMVGYVLLELEKLAEQAPELRFVVEKVLGQGTVPGSNWGQRLCELVLHMWDVVFDVLDGAYTAAQRRDSAELDGWFSRREAAGLVSRLHSRGGYTDDTKFRFVGPERARRGAKLRTRRTRWRVDAHPPPSGTGSQRLSGGPRAGRRCQAAAPALSCPGCLQIWSAQRAAPPARPPRPRGCRPLHGGPPRRLSRPRAA